MQTFALVIKMNVFAHPHGKFKNRRKNQYMFTSFSFLLLLKDYQSIQISFITSSPLPSKIIYIYLLFFFRNKITCIIE